MPTRHPGLGFSATVFVALMIASISTVACAASATSRRVEKLREMMRELPDGVFPLYVIGDLNEDGKVNGGDLRILTELVASLDNKSPAPHGLSCIAAGDVNRDGDLDSADVAMLKDWLARAPELSAPALY